MIYKNCKGKVTNHYGYVLIWKPEHPFCNSTGYIMEHRFVMEQHIGRYLKQGEVVHHINKNKSDNRVENLELMEDSAHRSFNWHEMRNQGKFYPPPKRPDITIEKIQTILKNKVSIIKIAKMLNCSRQTIYRKIWAS